MIRVSYCMLVKYGPVPIEGELWYFLNLDLISGMKYVYLLTQEVVPVEVCVEFPPLALL